MDAQMHETVPIKLRGHLVQIDSPIATMVERINVLGFRTQASCCNYGDYLRQVSMLADFGLDHQWDSKRDYGYLQFEDWDVAKGFLDFLKDELSLIDPLYFRLIHQGTPDAWEVRIVIGWECCWVLFPVSDIEGVTAILNKAIANEQNTSQTDLVL